MKTKETTCRVCDGHGKPSKGLINIHNIQTTDLSKEFQDKLVDCLKCENCGHSWIPNSIPNKDIHYNSFYDGSKGENKIKSNRELALQWWNTLSSLRKTQICDTNTEYLKGIRRYETLTGIEIEGIWKYETSPINNIPDEYINVDFEGIEEEHNIKPNSKQYKEFSPELFKSYINKFSNEDKLKALEILLDNCPIKWDGINNNANFYMLVCRAYNAGKQNVVEQYVHQDDTKHTSSEDYFRKEFMIK